MNRNLDASIRVEDVAEAAHTSVGHLTREFRVHFGMPPHRYLIRLRVDRARKLLASTDLPIAVIAYECGFAHQEHLTRHFKRELDATPAAYRRFAGGRPCTTGVGMPATC
jgi:AraC family transcriptional regulator